MNRVPGRSCCFSLGEINSMCAISNAFHKFHSQRRDFPPSVIYPVLSAGTF